MPGGGPAPALLVAPKREPPWAVLRMAGAPEILGLTAWAGVGASRTSWLLSLEPQARRGRAGCSVSSRGVACCHGCWCEPQEQRPGGRAAGREGDSLRGLRAHDQTCLDQVCYEVGEHGVGAQNNRGGILSCSRSR